jgi:hypothetical protein
MRGARPDTPIPSPLSLSSPVDAYTVNHLLRKYLTEARCLNLLADDTYYPQLGVALLAPALPNLPWSY